MKTIIIILIGISLTGIHLSSEAQTRLNAGGGFFGEKITNPGLVLEFEVERFHGEGFSLPLKANLVGYSHPDYNAFSFEVQKGFRKYFKSGLFLEQSLGLGIISKSFKDENYWYYDEVANAVPHGNRSIFGFMPSITLGAGYALSKNKEAPGLIWIRPKIYWDLGFRGLHLPYTALQIGYTHTIKIK